MCGLRWMKGTRAMAAAVGVAGLGPAALAISGDTFDTFQDGTIMGWAGGTTRTNEAGGPAGPTDRYLRVVASVGSASGSKVATHNDDGRWLGNYQMAGITAIQCDLRNEGSVALEMRIVLFGLTPMSGTRYTSVSAVALPVGGAWQTVTFPIGPASLTQVLGNVTYQDMITNVTSFMIRHDPGTPSSGGVSANGTVGIDNIRAIPAPGAGVLGVLAYGALTARRRR